ncbi:MAG: hypothetical protein AUK63_1798 [bacterium P3]|nr:MAG: hypothetical protein AUK63_1798 [bacterium P3]KWW38618.1 MAG: hypothetical protein F083_2207 [bacterium F083]
MITVLEHLLHGEHLNAEEREFFILLAVIVLLVITAVVIFIKGKHFQEIYWKLQDFWWWIGPKSKKRLDV